MSTLYIKKHHGFSNSHISDKQYALSSPLTNHSVLIHAYFKVNPSTRNDKALLHVNMNIIYKQKVDWLKFAHTSSKSIIYSKHNIIIYEKKTYILLGLIICPKILQMFNSKYHHIRNNISWKYINKIIAITTFYVHVIIAQYLYFYYAIIIWPDSVFHTYKK